MSVVIPREGPAESRGELDPMLRMFLAGRGIPSRWSNDRISVAVGFRDAIEAVFADLPASSEGTWSTHPGKPRPLGDLEPDTESLGPSRIRILHVSKSGAVKRLTLHKGESRELPKGIPAADAAVNQMDEMFFDLARQGWK